MRRRTLLLFLPLILAGCAGESVTPVYISGVRFAKGSGYNGMTSLLRANGPSDLGGSDAGTTTTTGRVSDAARRVSFTIPTLAPEPGQTFPFSAGGAIAEYTEPNGRRWVANGGGLLIERVEANLYRARLVGATFAADPASGARGTVTLRSDDLPFGYGVDEGPGELALLGGRPDERGRSSPFGPGDADVVLRGHRGCSSSCRNAEAATGSHRSLGPG